MKQSFSVIDRALIMQLLPAEENVLTLRIIRKIKDEIGFSEEELKQIKMVDGGNISKQQTLPAKEIEIGEKGFDVIATALKQLNDRKKLTELHIPLYERFVENVPKEG